MRRTIGQVMAVGALLGSGLVPVGPAQAAEPAGPPAQVLAFTGYRGDDGTSGLMTLDTATGEQRTVADGFTYRASWSPSGTQLAWISYDDPADDLGRVQVADTGTGAVNQLVGDGDSRGLSWGPDGTLAYLHRSEWWPTDCTATDRLTRHDVVLRAPDGTSRTLTTAAATARDLRFSPDGANLTWFESGEDVCAGADTRLLVADVASGTVRVVAGQFTGGGPVSFTPDGRTAALTTADGTGSDVVLVDLATATPRRLATPGVNEQFPVVSPDGTGIAVARYEAGRQSISLIALDGALVRELGAGPDEVDALAWAPSGAGLAVAGATLTSNCGDEDDADCDFSTADPAIWWQPADGAAASVLSGDGELSGSELAFAPWSPAPPVVERHRRGVRDPAS